MFACSDFYFRLHLLLIIIHITCISLYLRRTSAPIHLTSVLGVLGTQETSCILIAELLERDIFDLFLPEFDKPWVIHLRETCCCSTNLYTWMPNTVYKNRSVRRHQGDRGGGLVDVLLYLLLRGPLYIVGRGAPLPPPHASPRAAVRRGGKGGGGQGWGQAGSPRNPNPAGWYVSNVSIIFDAPCLFLHHLPIVSLHLVALLCIFQK
jgi:hypothetical protein